MTLVALRERVAGLLDEPLTDDRDNLLDLGLDSLRLMRLVEELRAEGIDVSLVDLAERPTIADWAELIGERGVG